MQVNTDPHRARPRQRSGLHHPMQAPLQCAFTWSRVMSKLMWILARCMATALGSGGAQARVPVPPLAATLVQVCRDQPCLVKLPDVVPLPQVTPSKSRKRLTRRST